MEHRVRTWATVALAAGLVALGLVTGLHVAAGGDPGTLPSFRVASLLGAGAMVLAGLLLRSRMPSIGSAVLVVGAVAGIAASFDTVVLPLLVLVVVGLTLRDQTRVRV